MAEGTCEGWIAYAPSGAEGFGYEEQVGAEVAAAARASIENAVLKRRCEPEDIAEVVLFLCADDSRMITAQQFVIDGGWANT